MCYLHKSNSHETVSTGRLYSSTILPRIVVCVFSLFVSPPSQSIPLPSPSLSLSSPRGDERASVVHHLISPHYIHATLNYLGYTFELSPNCRHFRFRGCWVIYKLGGWRRQCTTYTLEYSKNSFIRVEESSITSFLFLLQ